MAATIGGLFFVVYVGCIAGIVIYLLRLLGRFVQTQQRMASALELIARKYGETDKR